MSFFLCKKDIISGHQFYQDFEYNDSSINFIEDVIEASPDNQNPKKIWPEFPHEIVNERNNFISTDLFGKELSLNIEIF